MPILTDSEAKKGGTLNHIALYQKIASRSEEIYSVLFELLKSRNENIRLGAVKTLINKIVPDLKSLEVGGQLGEDGKRRAIEILVNAGRGFLPATVQLLTSSNPSATGGQPQIQNPNLAPQGTKDNNINIGSNQAGASEGGSVLAPLPDKGGG